MKPKIEIIAFVHRLFYNGVTKKGGFDFILEDFTKRGKSILLVESPLDYGLGKNTNVTLIENGEAKFQESYSTYLIHYTISWIVETLYFVYVAFKYKINNNVCITADPLTSIGGVILRKIGKVKFLYFHLTDFSESRFPNKYLNGLYKLILKIAILNSDLVGCVSLATVREVTKIGAKNVCYIPNSRDFYADVPYRKSVNERKKGLIVVTCAAVSPRYNILETVQLVEKLIKTNTEVQLAIIGGIDLEKDYVEEIKKYIENNNLSNYVKLVGFVDRKESVEIISTAWIGLAFFNTKYSFQRFGDSLKVREYASMGVPTIMDDIVISTTEELRKYNAGIVVKSIELAESELRRLLNDQKLYEELSANSLQWSKELDKKLILDKLEKDIFN